MSFVRHASIMIAASAMLAARTARSETITLPASQDATLFESEFGDTASGAGNYLFAGTTAQDFIRRGLVQFDLSRLPIDAAITGAHVRLHMSRTATAGVVIDLHRVTRTWSEGPSVPFAEEGAGVPAEPGDVTWLHTRFDWDAPEYWERAGGDFIDVPSASTIVYGNGFYEWHDPQLAHDVRLWAKEPLSNAGWAVLGEESTPQTAKRFDSRTHPDETVRPQLVIEFVRIPEPSGLILVAVAVLSMARARL
ncbi:MAG: DNRLRE domain-containing protein [Phycisphaerales bacterium]|nr:DNRLRE domain-containing protein [Phycisphaerales bacterium]